MIKHTAPTLALLALGAGLAACADTRAPLDPIAAAPSRNEVAADAPRHILAYDDVTGEALAAEVAARGGTVDWIHEGARIAVVSGLADEAAVALTGVSIAERDSEITTGSTAEPVVSEEMSGAAGEAEAASQSNPTTSFFYSRQWHLRQIQANAAWAAGRLGSPSVSIAILDTGIDYTYPDLNGLVDLSRSKSFVPSDDAAVQALYPGRHPITDLQYHGTHVAALASSKSGTVSGVASRVTLIGVKVLARTGSGPTSGVLNGVLYAADVDADIINMSLGSSFARPGNGEFNALVNRVFNYAYRQGSLVVVSASNDRTDLSHNTNRRFLYCEAPNVVCVSSTGPTSAASVNGPWANLDTFQPYSNYGAPVTLAAPGGGNTSGTGVWSACPTTSQAVPICRTGTFTLSIFGTSQASPQVAGLAALLVEEIGKDRPAQVRARLKQGTDDLGKNGQDELFGAGRINVRKTLGL
jgi:lantibiotic leader peptide-processing serine protease